MKYFAEARQLAGGSYDKQKSFRFAFFDNGNTAESIWKAARKWLVDNGYSYSYEVENIAVPIVFPFEYTS